MIFASVVVAVIKRCKKCNDEQRMRLTVKANPDPDVYEGKVFVDGIMKQDTKVLKRIAA